MDHPEFPGQSARQGTRKLDVEIEMRTLNDGRTFRIIKRVDKPEDLKARLSQAGIQAQTGLVGDQFLYAIGTKD